MDKAVLMDKLKAVMDLKDQLEKMAMHEEGSESPLDEMKQSPEAQSMEDKLGLEKHPEMAEEVVEDKPDFKSMFQEYMNGKDSDKVMPDEMPEEPKKKSLMIAMSSARPKMPMAMKKKK